MAYSQPMAIYSCNCCASPQSYSSIDSLISSSSSYSAASAMMPAYEGSQVISHSKGSYQNSTASRMETIIMSSGYSSAMQGYAHSSAGSYSSSYSAQPRQSYQRIENFLSSVRPITQFVDDAAQVEDYIRETFLAVTGKLFPDNITIRVCSQKDLQTIHESHGAAWSDGILGFAVNMMPTCGEIFVKKDALDRLMLVIGHEIGHLMTGSLTDSLDEEAKAFSFEFAWAKAIKDHNIANLSDCIRLNFSPAKNGLHDVAWNFVVDALKKGKKAIEVFGSLISGKMSCRKNNLITSS